MQQEQRNKRCKKKGVLYFTLFSDMMKYLITDSEERGVRQRCGREVKHEM